MAGTRPLYRSVTWRNSARGLEDRKKRKSKNWLGSYKSCIFVPPTPNSELQKQMQLKEKELRPGGRENFPIKIVETAGKPLERVLVNNDPFDGNKCSDKQCLPNRNPKNRISCRKNNVGYELKCKICHWAGGSGPEPELNPATYFNETGENLHTRMKNHESKFRSKLLHIRQHCDPVGQKNPPLLQRQAFRAVSYSEYQIISKPWAWKPPLLDELTKFGQRESSPAILSLY